MLLLAVLLAASCNAHPSYTVQPVLTHVQTTRQGGRYVASAQVRFTLKDQQPALLTSTDPGLLDHVQGHLRVAQRVIASSNGLVQANAAGAAQARTRLNQTVARMRADLQKELAREEQAYENVTASGASQSQGPSFGFPGGADVHSPCVR